MRERIALAVVLSCSLGLVACKRPEKPAEAAASAEATRSVVPVETVRVRPEPVSQDLVVNGTVIPRAQVQVLPKASGRLLTLSVQEGDRVSRGQIIARLETPELEWQLRQQESGILTAQANLEQARDNLTRISDLARDGAVSQAQLKAAQTQVKVAEAGIAQSRAAINLLKSQLSSGTVTSPISGVVVTRHVDPGALAGPSTPLVTIADTSALQVKLPVAERDLGLVREGGQVTVESVALPGEAFRGRVAEIAPLVDAQTRLIHVKVDLPAPGRLKVGMNVSTRLKGPAHAALVVPSAAIVTDGAEEIVFVAQASQAVRVAIAAGIRDPLRTEVVSGLKPGDAVIVKGSSFVKDGDPIAVNGGK
ncbi:MAG: efflux RND transporter periplasmic adaptor subunit [bacterium]|nr:efflux RND transporter periplasmic adaptor subunit [bacterium]